MEALLAAYNLKADNHALKAKNLIESLNNVNYKPEAGQLRQTKLMVDLVANNGAFFPIAAPPLGASFEENGRFLEKFHQAVTEYAKSYHEDDVFICAASDSNQDWAREMLLGGTGRPVDGAPALLDELVNVWLAQNKQYAQNRIDSLLKQLQNAGVNITAEDALFEDAAKVRKMVGELRRAFIDTLHEIQDKVARNDPLDLVTAKEKELLARHSSWLDKPHTENTDYMPNDGAVSYSYLLYEVCVMVLDGSSLTGQQAWEAVWAFFEMGHHNLLKDSSRRGWKLLGGNHENEHHGIDIGKVWGKYATDNERCIASEEKYASPVGRGPLRIMRMSAIMFGMGGAFSIYNAPQSEFMAQAVWMRDIEKQIEEHLKAQTEKRAALSEFSVSLAAVWAVALDAGNIHVSRTGRNDLSVPKLVGKLIDIPTDGFDDLDPRDWALMRSVTGLSKVRKEAWYDVPDPERDPSVGAGGRPNAMPPSMHASAATRTTEDRQRHTVAAISTRLQRMATQGASVMPATKGARVVELEAAFAVPPKPVITAPPGASIQHMPGTPEFVEIAGITIPCNVPPTPKAGWKAKAVEKYMHNMPNPLPKEKFRALSAEEQELWMDWQKYQMAQKGYITAPVIPFSEM